MRRRNDGRHDMEIAWWLSDRGLLPDSGWNADDSPVEHDRVYESPQARAARKRNEKRRKKKEPPKLLPPIGMIWRVN